MITMQELNNVGGGIFYAKIVSIMLFFVDQVWKNYMFDPI